MARLSHSKSVPVAELLARVTRRLQRARLCYGHGTDRARDDAAALIWHALKLPPRPTLRQLARPLTTPQLTTLERLVTRRVAERVPVVYLTQRAWFAGLEMFIDERVLIPRSPLAELIEVAFKPWIDAQRVARVADVGTGSGCIAIACAYAFAHARVDAVDISEPALQVARLNVRRHRLTARVKVLRSDHFSALKAQAYDIIVSNPPYVGAAELATLPLEYGHEPVGALAAGIDGMDSVRALLRDAAQYLRPGGILVVEVGNTERRVRQQFPRVPFTWLEFSRGGGGVFLLTREQLVGPAVGFARPAATKRRRR